MAINTRQRILDAALVIVNEHGLERLSTREVANALALSTGNVSYHFPKREDLFAGLAEQLSQGTRLGMQCVPQTPAALLESYRIIFRHHHQHRGLVLSLPHAVAAFPWFREDYRAKERARRAAVRHQFAHLRRLKQLALTDQDMDRMVSHFTLIARFWVAESQVSFADVPTEQVIDHYLALLAGLLSAHTECELQDYLDRLLVFDHVGVDLA